MRYIPGAIVVAALCLNAAALTFVSNPGFAPATNAPLAGTLSVTTDVPSRVTVSMSDGTTNWVRAFHDYSTSHALPLLGFKPSGAYLITVTVTDKHRQSLTAAQPLAFNTPALPGDFPKSVVFASAPDRMEPGYTLTRIINRNSHVAYILMVDNTGATVWYSKIATTADVRQLDNGDLFIPLTSTFVEANMLGNTVKTWTTPAGLPINLHDGVPTPHGTILYLSDAGRTVDNFPTSATDPNAPTATTNVLYNQVVEISATDSSLVDIWTPLDVLDPRRLTYLTFDIKATLGWDIEHCNAIIEDPRDHTLIVSMRNQNCVVKIRRDTGQLKWILGPHENWGPAFQAYLLTPVGESFAWQYGQHAPVITPQGTLLLYDDGNDRATPFAPPLPDTSNYSRAVEYAINEDTLEISQVWEYSGTNTDRLYTDRVGNADHLPKTGNVLLNFGYIVCENGIRPSTNSPTASAIRIKEVTHDAAPEVLFDLAFFDYANTSGTFLGYNNYRAHRVPDLYPHLPRPVEDLDVHFDHGAVRLEFSGDETRTYAVEASSDLVTWESLGEATAEDALGDFGFEDSSGGDLGTRFYRVESQ